MSDGRKERLRHADMVDGDVMGSKGMGGKLVVMVDDGCFELCTCCLGGESASATGVFLLTTVGGTQRSHGTFDTRLNFGNSQRRHSLCFQELVPPL